jgi:flagellar biogenesis protein FliO
MIDWKAFRQQMQSDPKKVLGFVIGLATVFFVMWAYVLLTSNLKKEAPETVQINKLELPERVEEYEPAMAAGLSGTDSTAMQTESNAGQLPSFRSRKAESGDNLPDLMPVMLLFLAVVSGFWVMRKGRKKLNTSDFMDVLGTQQLAVNQQLSLVHINSEYWVLAHSNGGINLLQRYSETEWKGKKAASDRKNGQKSLDASFLSLLKRENQQYETLSKTT